VRRGRNESVGCLNCAQSNIDTDDVPVTCLCSVISFTLHFYLCRSVKCNKKIISGECNLGNCGYKVSHQLTCLCCFREISTVLYLVGVHRMNDQVCYFIQKLPLQNSDSTACTASQSMDTAELLQTRRLHVTQQTTTIYSHLQPARWVMPFHSLH
jgi:hypothetical protein